MGAGVTFKPGGPSCPGGPRTPTPGDPCMVAEHMACPLSGSHRGAGDTGVPGALCHPEWPHKAGERSAPLGPRDTYLLSFGSRGPLGSLQRHQATRKGWAVGAEDPPDSICGPQHPSRSPPCASYLHLPQDPPAPRILLAPPGSRKQVKSRVGRRRAGGAAPTLGSQLRSPGPPGLSPHQSLGTALTFSPLGPGKPRSPLEPYQGESSVRGGGSHGTGSPPSWHGGAVGG